MVVIAAPVVVWDDTYIVMTFLFPEVNNCLLFFTCIFFQIFNFSLQIQSVLINVFSNTQVNATFHPLHVCLPPLYLELTPHPLPLALVLTTAYAELPRESHSFQHFLTLVTLTSAKNTAVPSQEKVDGDKADYLSRQH